MERLATISGVSGRTSARLLRHLLLENAAVHSLLQSWLPVLRILRQADSLHPVLPR